MEHQKVYYLGSYNTLNSRYNRRYTISATVKMDYIISALNQAGYNVELISPSYILDTKWCFDKGGKKHLNEQTILNLSPSFGSPFSPLKYIGISFTMFFVFLKLLKLKKKDTLIVYHGVWYSLIITIAKWLKGFQLIVEVEEIYTHAFNRNIKGLKKELDFIKSADKLILVNDLLADYLEYPKEKSVISYGPYNVINSDKAIVFEDTKIHLVYAGSFSKRKSGAQSSVAVAQYLPENYVIHILGYGDKETTDELIAQIDQSNKKYPCKVFFQGEKSGDDYLFFMQGCHIGLCTQKLGCDYTRYAFPSKVLAYMAFGLNVVTAPLVALPGSSIHEYLNYYNDDTPQSLAKAILCVKLMHRSELKEVIAKLNNEFVLNLKKIVQCK